MGSLVGSRVERKEDKRFLTGKGRYTADININNQTYAVFVRSPHARAKIKKVDFSKASKASGVVSILTGADIVNDKIGGLIAGWKLNRNFGVFGEGRYLSYWGIDSYEVKLIIDSFF